MIITVEDNLIETTRNLFGKTLRAVDTVPGPLNLAVVKQMISQSPAIYFAFLGGGPGIQDGSINARFDAFISTKHVRQVARRRGDKTQIGAYEILGRLLPVLDGHTVPDVGTLKLKRVTNLFSGQMDKDMGAALYAATFELPNMSFDTGDSTGILGDGTMGSLDNFITFHADYERDLTTDGEPVATDEITLPQE